MAFITCAAPVMSQDTSERRTYSNKDLIQFSGVIITSDSLNPIPFAHIVVLNDHRGTVSDYNGYFSFVAKKKDSIKITAVGFKDEIFIIPDTILNNRYSMIQVMATDTVYLSETVIYPWPTREQFREAFLMLDIPDDDLELARKNLDQKELSRRAEHMKTDGSMTYKFMYNDYVDKLYYNGQTQPITILNPFAWAKFIQAWKEGKFKKQD